jgi:hypothetical protein
MERVALLKSITFGQPVAEDETAALGRYFVETDQWDRIYRGEIDIVRGDKGAGKSAIYSLLAERIDTLFNDAVLLTTGENPRGATAFSDLLSEPPTSELEFVSLWKLYIVSVVALKLKEFGPGGANFEKLSGLLSDEKILEEGFDLQRIFKRVRSYIGRRGPLRTIEGTIAVDPTTWIPTASGKITLGEPGEEAHARGAVSIDRMAKLANDVLEEQNFAVWVLLDRLDVAFIENHDLERNALRALFRVYRDFAGLDRIKLKIFLRSDIWSRIMDGGFREASHITRYVDLEWRQPALLNLIVRRLLNNPALVAEYKIDSESVLKSSEEQLKLFYQFFPAQVEQGTKKRATLDWIVSRCADGKDNTAPREIVQLLNKMRDEEIARLELGGQPPEDGRLFDRSVFKVALSHVSKARLVQTLYAEYPDLKPFLEKLEGAKTEQRIETLQAIWKTDAVDTAKIITGLIEVGFFQQRGSREEPTYWVPFLYRDALKMSQGLADD